MSDYQQHGPRHGRLVQVGATVGSDPPRPDGARLAWGRMHDDGLVADAGSGDWSAVPDGVMVVTFDPAWNTNPAVTVTPTNDLDGPYSPLDLPPAITAPDVTAGVVRADNVDLSTVTFTIYDMDGNPTLSNVCGFSFIAVGT